MGMGLNIDRTVAPVSEPISSPVNLSSLSTPSRDQSIFVALGGLLGSLSSALYSYGEDVKKFAGFCENQNGQHAGTANSHSLSPTVAATQDSSKMRDSSDSTREATASQPSSPPLTPFAALHAQFYDMLASSWQKVFAAGEELFDMCRRLGIDSKDWSVAGILSAPPEKRTQIVATYAQEIMKAVAGSNDLSPEEKEELLGKISILQNQIQEIKETTQAHVDTEAKELDGNAEVAGQHSDLQDWCHRFQQGKNDLQTWHNNLNQQCDLTCKELQKLRCVLDWGNKNKLAQAQKDVSKGLESIDQSLEARPLAEALINSFHAAAEGKITTAEKAILTALRQATRIAKEAYDSTVASFKTALTAFETAFSKFSTAVETASESPNKSRHSSDQQADSFYALAQKTLNSLCTVDIGIPPTFMPVFLSTFIAFFLRVEKPYAEMTATERQDLEEKIAYLKEKLGIEVLTSSDGTLSVNDRLTYLQASMFDEKKTKQA